MKQYKVYYYNGSAWLQESPVFDLWDSAFQDMLTNRNSSVVYLEYNRFTGQVKVCARVIENRLRDYKKGLSYQDMNRLYKQFLTVNNITKQKAG